MVSKPEQWRIITPLLSIANFLGITVVGVMGWFMVRTIDQFDKHLDKLDAKYESQSDFNRNIDRKLALVEGRCCRKSALANDGDNFN